MKNHAKSPIYPFLKILSLNFLNGEKFLQITNIFFFFSFLKNKFRKLRNFPTKKNTKRYATNNSFLWWKFCTILEKEYFVKHALFF
jgi:hypothetical protein